MAKALSAEIRQRLETDLAIPLWPDWATIMGFSRPFVYGLASKGEIEGAFRMGRCWRIPTIVVRRQLMLDPSNSLKDASQVANAGR